MPPGITYVVIQPMLSACAVLRRPVVWAVLASACAINAALTQEPAREQWRPVFHFTPAKNWMNDPNGLVFYNGEYHLFYQHNPFGDTWGHMSWGHAVSRDLVHWQHLPVALNEENGVMVFSGSAVVDWKNTSGFGKDGRPPLVAIYTGHYTGKPLQNENIAYSADRGRTWTKYAGNPVLDIGEKDFRDPKVFWHEGTRRWIMAAAWPTQRQVRLYASPNLKEWTHLSDFGPADSVSGIWECPDLFPLGVEGEPGSQRWVLVVNVRAGAPAGGSGTEYFVRTFDGTRFVSTAPVKELEALRGQHADSTIASVRGDADLSKLNALVQGPFELQVGLTPSADAAFEFTLRTGTSEELALRVDVPGRKLTLDRTRSGNVGFHKQFPGAADAPLRLLDGRLRMHLYVDASSVEVFLNDGETVMTSLFLPSVGDRRVELEVKRGEVRGAKLEVWRLMQGET